MAVINYVYVISKAHIFTTLVILQLMIEFIQGGNAILFTSAVKENWNAERITVLVERLQAHETSPLYFGRSLQ